MQNFCLRKILEKCLRTWNKYNEKQHAVVHAVFVVFIINIVVIKTRRRSNGAFGEIRVMICAICKKDAVLNRIFF